MVRALSLAVGLAAPLAALGLGACQDTTSVVIDNRCSAAIEVDVNDVADPVSLGSEIIWKSVPSGEEAPTRSVADPVERALYVWVRLSGSAVVPEPLVFEPTDFEASEQNVVAVIVGDLCPRQ